MSHSISSCAAEGGHELLGLLVFLALAILAARGSRWAYDAFALMIPLSFFAFTGFRGDPNPCELAFDLHFIFHALPNYPHILLFAFFFLVTAGHFRFSSWQLWIGGIGLTMAMGAAMEIAQGLSGGTLHCKAVDLVPDFIGALLDLGPRGNDRARQVSPKSQQPHASKPIDPLNARNGSKRTSG